MNRLTKFNAAGSPVSPAVAGPVIAPVAGPATSIGAADHRRSPYPTGEAGAPSLSTLSYRCPDCNGPFTYRVVDEDTGCRYPVDDGEHYCLNCDAIWSDDDLPPSGWALAERSVAQ